MAVAKITKRQVDAQRPDEAKDVYLWDSEIPGFGLKVTPNGARTYLFQYRNRARRTRRITIGTPGDIYKGKDGSVAVLTPERARNKAAVLRGRVKAGEDPAQEHTEWREAKTVSAAVDIFLKEYVASECKAATAAEYRRLADKHIKTSNLGGTKLVAADRSIVAALHRAMRKTPYQANRVLALLGSFFTWAIDQKIFAGPHPTRGIKKHREHARQRFLSPAELATVGATLAAAESDCPVAVNALRLLAITGMRKSEVLTLRWSYIDRERGAINLPDSKTGAKSIPLTANALEILDTMGKRRDAENARGDSDGVARERSPYVFPGKRPGARLVGLQKIWERLRASATVAQWRRAPEVPALIDRLAADLKRDPSVAEIRAEAERAKVELPRGLDDVRLHDFRHTVASVGASGGDSLLILGSILGHVNASTTQRYAHLHDDPRKAAAEKIASNISASMRGGGAEVVPLRRGA